MGYGTGHWETYKADARAVTGETLVEWSKKKKEVIWLTSPIFFSEMELFVHIGCSNFWFWKSWLSLENHFSFLCFSPKKKKGFILFLHQHMFNFWCQDCIQDAYSMNSWLHLELMKTQTHSPQSLDSSCHHLVLQSQQPWEDIELDVLVIITFRYVCFCTV